MGCRPYNPCMWVAIYFAVFVAAGVGAYLWFALAAIANGGAVWPWIVAFPFAYAAVPLFFTCFWMFFGWAWRAKAPADVAMSPGERVRFFLAEYAALFAAPKMILYALIARDPPPARATCPVLLLHGIGCNGGVWTGMRAFLARVGIGPVYAMSYGPPFIAIPATAPQVAEKIAQIERDTGASQVVIVAHSMGGLVARSYLRAYGPSHVRRLVTIGTPYAGSMHAWLMSGASVLDMRPGSPYLATLTQPTAGEKAVPTVSIWSWHDTMVTPQDSSRLPYGANLVLAKVAHNALINDARVKRRVADEISSACAAATNVSPSSAVRTPSAPA
jgi:triacylglycerol esterase/lipase EstA (alpha/beta hydrolase family)